MTRWLAVILALCTVLALTPAASAAPGRPFTNPVKPVKGADPWIAFHEGSYYLISTTFTNTLTMRKSPTLAGLPTAPSVQVWQDTTASRGTNFWAPEIHFLNNRWYLYYSAARVGAACCDTQRTHVLESAGTDPLGPYTYKNMLTGASLTPGGWLIDASPMRLNGSLYLMGSGFINGSPQSLVIAPMSNPYTLSGDFSVISQPTYPWERSGKPVNEGPVALQRDGRTHVVFSASACGTPDYQLGLLTYTSGDPRAASSWAKAANPIFQRNDANRVYGPGHNGFFTSPDGTESWIVYHANNSADGGCGNARTTRAQKFTWNADGTPNLGTPVRTGATLNGPAGETAATPTAYRIVNRNSGKCLNVKDSSTADGGDVVQHFCDGGLNQRWRIEDLGNDTSRVVNVRSGKALDVNACGTGDGANIQQWAWRNNTCQQWRLIVSAQDGWVRLHNVNSGKVADVANCGTGDGADVRQWSWLDNNCQQWQLVPA
ncbi:family 43 glycosylhydrolase [Crossiella sp. SN42]|uniref:family 43 glycosylhydrolase n=1 Tax=Crossiella sp. SN42 TaxID=2944808 RepID=UPI00207D2004|nr:family 43 glycosylhydrolase [Crossiella sp. SN42]MCO1574181.1 family 43 glycosylhydrolase [Crossiella sp. SN42]